MGESLGKCDRLYESEQARNHTFLLPLFHHITQQEQDYVVKVLKMAYRVSARVVNASKCKLQKRLQLKTTVCFPSLPEVFDSKLAYS
jgi:dTDP-4-amino-4,6-dideoxygalactose transaminase